MKIATPSYAFDEKLFKPYLAVWALITLALATPAGAAIGAPRNYTNAATPLTAVNNTRYFHSDNDITGKGTLSFSVPAPDLAAGTLNTFTSTVAVGFSPPASETYSIIGLDPAGTDSVTLVLNAISSLAAQGQPFETEFSFTGISETALASALRGTGVSDASTVNMFLTSVNDHGLFPAVSVPGTFVKFSNGILNGTAVSVPEPSAGVMGFVFCVLGRRKRRTGCQ